MYRIVPIADDFFEVCDECGFDGGLVDMRVAAELLRSLGERWASVFSHSEELLRARPAPDTWCLVEYAQHTTFALGAIEWAAGEFVKGRSPDWTQEPADLAGLTLTPAEQDRRADYGDGLVINTAAVVRHALHDSEHHLLDIRRGIARLQLAATN